MENPFDNKNPRNTMARSLRKFPMSSIAAHEGAFGQIDPLKFSIPHKELRALEEKFKDNPEALLLAKRDYMKQWWTNIKNS